MEQLPRDIYLKIADEVVQRDEDDMIILNMLRVNKKYYKDEHFQRLMQKRYPLLIKYKRQNESWKRFYLRMIHYISLLKEEFDIPYFPNPKFDPEYFYKKMSLVGFESMALDNLLGMAAENGNMALIKHLMAKGAVGVSYAATYAAENGHLEAFKYLIAMTQNLAYIIPFSFAGAAKEGYKNILEYILNTPELKRHVREAYYTEALSDPGRTSVSNNPRMTPEETHQYLLEKLPEMGY